MTHNSPIARSNDALQQLAVVEGGSLKALKCFRTQLPEQHSSETGWCDADSLSYLKPIIKAVGCYVIANVRKNNIT